MKRVGVKSSRLRVGFDGLKKSFDEGTLDLKYAAVADNFSFDKGALTGKIGIDPAKKMGVAGENFSAFEADKKIKNIFLYRYNSGESGDMLVAQLTDGSVWVTNLFSSEGWQQIDGLYLTGDVSAANYNYDGTDILLLSSGTDGLYMIKNRTGYVCGSAPKFTSITIHNERVFGAVGGNTNQVWFSDDFNPLNWRVSSDEAGYINFADECGEVIKVVSFTGYLFIFREYGIARLKAYGDQAEFVLNKLFTDVGHIVKDSIAICGNRIVFYAETGIFTFDGYEVSRLSFDLPELDASANMIGAYLDDYYYLSCTRIVDDKKERCVIRYDLAHKEQAVLSDIRVRTLLKVNVKGGAKVLCAFEGKDANMLGEMSKSGAVMGVNTKKLYRSGKAMPLSSAIKTVRSISLVTENPIAVTLIADGKRYEYPLEGSKNMQTVRVEHWGRRLSFELSTDEAEAYVLPMSADVDILEV